MKKLYKILFIFIAFYHITACANSVDESVQIYHDIMTETSFRAWNEKGLGKIVNKDNISVITGSDRKKSDVVILRWSEDRSSFQTEVYRSTSSTEKTGEWDLVSSSQEKTLTDQRGKFFLILELISGTEGGQKTEMFSLPK